MLTSEQYAAANTSEPGELLQEILEFTLQHHPAAHMISGHVQGQLLKQLSSMLSPLRILEIGTFTGFSALCLAEGLQKHGLLYTIELREKDAAVAQGFFDRSSNKERIKLLTGNAIDIIPQLHETWDLVFIDADKTGYLQYYEMILPQVRTGGVIIADNVLFHGEVLQEILKGKNAIAIDAFNKHVKNDNRVEQVLLTVRDGLLLVQKK
ncbi:MAG: O-methyltransferase [Bacteroidota bacterium]